MEHENKIKHSLLKKTILICLSLILISSIFVLYSRYIATKGIIVNEYKVLNKNLSDDFYGLKIVHITDIHYGKTTFQKDLKELVKKVNLTKPDIIVFTGDLIDEESKITNKEKEKIASILNEMSATIGKYAIMGNHDITLSEFDMIMENAGFKNISDSYELIYTKSSTSILLAGISTISKEPKNINEKLTAIKEYLNILGEDQLPNYKILIMHEPDEIDSMKDISFDLVLAGHSHLGQVRLPIIGAVVTPEGAKKYKDEYYQKGNTDLYISGGIGTSKISFRLFNRPSFNLYRLVNH